MEREDLERVINEKIKPIFNDLTVRNIGVKIDKMTDDLSEKLKQPPFLDFVIDTSISFKAAKKKFKEFYISKILEVCEGNISEVARILNVDRRSIHRLIKNTKVHDIRRLMVKPYAIKKEALDRRINTVLDSYKEIIHPIKLRKMYEDVSKFSDEILKELPADPLSLKDAEEIFEKRFLTKLLSDFKFDVVSAARVTGLRRETLYRKIKQYRIM